MVEDSCQDSGDQDLQRENARLLDELQVAYGQMAEIMEAAEVERRVTYEQLRQRNVELQSRLDELEEAHARLQESQRLLLRAERLSAMGQMAAAIVHEINTPLTVISAKVELMLLDAQAPVVRAGLDEILKGVWRLDELVQNTLRVARQGRSQTRLVDGPGAGRWRRGPAGNAGVRGGAGQWSGDLRRPAGRDIRDVFHHQGGGQGHRTGAGDQPPHCRRPRRQHSGGIVCR